MSRQYETVWSFKTARFIVALEIEPEDMDPTDSFEFQEDIDAVRNGEVEWFCACVSVYLDDTRIAWDCLGGCAYRTVREFYTAHRDHPRNTMASRATGVIYCVYFPGMVRQAVAEARKVLCERPAMRCA